MKHVKEPLPDVQRRAARGVGHAGLGGRARHRQGAGQPLRHGRGHDRATSRRCWPSRWRAPARPGREATTVLRALDSDTKGFVPVRLRNPRRWLLSVLAVLILAAGAVAYFATRTEKGAGPPPTAAARGPDARCRWAPAPPTTTTPRATTASRPSRPRTSLDGNPSTQWDTERYDERARGRGQGRRGPVRGRRPAGRRRGR